MRSILRYSLRTCFVTIAICAILLAIVTALHRGVVRKQSALPGPTVVLFSGAKTYVILPEEYQFNEDAIRQQVMSNLPADSGFLASDVDIREFRLGSDRVIDFDFNQYYRCYLAWNGLRYSTDGEAGRRNQMMHGAIRKTQQQLAQAFTK